MGSRIPEERPEETNKPKPHADYTVILDSETIKDLLVTNAILERMLIKEVKKNIALEHQLDERNTPFFYFNKN